VKKSTPKKSTPMGPDVMMDPRSDEDIVVMIAECVSATAEHDGGTDDLDPDDIRGILVDANVDPRRFPALATLFVSDAETSEGWTWHEIRTVLAALGYKAAIAIKEE